MGMSLPAQRLLAMWRDFRMHPVPGGLSSWIGGQRNLCVLRSWRRIDNQLFESPSDTQPMAR